jgi:hypothetical protein
MATHYRNQDARHLRIAHQPDVVWQAANATIKMASDVQYLSVSRTQPPMRLKHAMHIKLHTSPFP